MNITNRVLVAVLVLGASLRAPAAQAKQPGPAELNEAQRRFQRATELYEENNLPGALAEFRKAYSLAPNYRVLYNIGQLCFLMQDNPCAYGAFSSYLAQGGGEIPDKRRQEVQRDLARLQARVAKLRILVDRPGAEVTVDDVSVGTTPLAEPVLVAAGRPRVRATLEGFVPATQVIEVAAMETARVELHLVPAPSAASRDDGAEQAARRAAQQAAAAPRPPVDPIASAPRDVTRETPAPSPSESSSGALTAAGVTLGTIGLAAVAGGAFSSFKVRSLERDIEGARLGEFDAATLASQRSTAQRYERWQWIGYGAGGAALVAATVLLMMDGKDGGSAEQARGPRLYGSIGAGGTVELGLGARF